MLEVSSCVLPLRTMNYVNYLPILCYLTNEGVTPFQMRQDRPGTNVPRGNNFTLGEIRSVTIPSHVSVTCRFSIVYIDTTPIACNLDSAPE
jgi:hypothetical protein